MADEKIAEFEERYDDIVQTAAKEYEDGPPSHYYKDGWIQSVFADGCIQA